MIDKETFWAILKGPEQFAHQTGQELAAMMNQKRLSPKRQRLINSHADGYIKVMMQLFDKEDLGRIIKTWLSIYRIPLDPDMLTTFDEYHILIGEHLAQQAFNIKPY